MRIFNNEQWRNICRNCLSACLLAFVFLIPSYANAYTYTGSCAPGSYASLSALITGCSGTGGINICKPFDVVGSCTGYSGDVNTAIGTMNVGGSRVFLWRSGTPDACPANSAWDSVGQQCRCSTGYSLYQGSCRADCPKTGEKDSNYGKWANSSSGGGKVCINSCCYSSNNCVGASTGNTPVATWLCSVGPSTGQYDDGTSTANFPSAQPSTDPAKTPKTPNDCYVQGKVYGEVNGVGTCVSPNDKTNLVESKTKTVTKTNGDGSTSSSTENTTTTDDGKNITTLSKTTTTTTNASGTASTSNASSTATQPASDYCKENPTSSKCTAEKSTWAGACSGAVTCTGDAVQCQIAQEQMKLNCALFDKSSTLAQLGEQLSLGTDPNAATSPFNKDNKSTVDLSGTAGKLDMSRLWSGQCLSNQSFTIAGQNIVIDFSKACDVVSLFGNLLVAVSLVSAVVIIGKGN